MPMISATFQPIQGHVLILIDWSDVGTVTFARVLRVTSDGVRTVVRPNTFADATGDYIELSGGSGVLYDTEAPLDVPVYYVTEGLGVATTAGAMLSITASDTFTRTVVDNWGAADTGQVYLNDTPDVDYDVAAGVGTIQPTVLNDDYDTWIEVSSSDQNIKANLTLNTLPAANTIELGLIGRVYDALNYYRVQVVISTTGAISLRLVKVLGGTPTVLTSVSLVDLFLAATQYTVVFQVVGSSLMTRLWPSAAPDPGWQLTWTDSIIPTGTAAGIFFRNNALVTTHILSVDNLVVSAQRTFPEVLTSGTNLWLKSPLHPWADQRVVLATPQEPDCLPASAIFFQSMTEETRGNRTISLSINNRRNPIALTRIRGGISSTLNLITRRFTDRDNVVTLNSTGDPLLFQGPAEYGIPDRYLTVGDFVVTRVTTDHRQQWRAHSLPHVEVDRPAGLADGVLGVRWVDLCNQGLTFDQAKVAGLTWLKIMAGYGAPFPVVSGFRLYSDITTDFATYGAISVGGRTYEDLMEGR